MYSCCCCLLLLLLMHFYSVILATRTFFTLQGVCVVYARHDRERESTTHSVTNRTCNAGRVGGSEFSMQCDQTDYRRLYQWVSIGTAARGNEPKSNELNETQWNETARTKRSRTNERTHNQLWWHLRITIILQGICISACQLSLKQTDRRTE